MKELKDGWLEYETEEEVTSRAKEAINVPFKNYNNYQKFLKENTGKGNIGQLVEEGWFKIKNNSRAEADFAIPGIELKVTGYYKLATDMLKAKERLVFNMLNYKEECGKDFYESSFIKKNKKIELMCYEYHKDTEKYPIYDWCISHANLLDLSNLPLVDQEIIKQDYLTINKKIQDGKAHEISEGDTLYLAACTKGATSQVRTEQPNSTELAKPRAYSFKPSYLNVILNNYIVNNNIEYESIIKNEKEIKEKSFEEIIQDKVQKYIGKSKDELIKIFELKDEAKSINALLFSRMLGLKGNVNNSEEFKKANIIVKTINQNYNGSVTESMSFKAFDPMDFDNTEWEDSEFYNSLNNKFLFIVFQKDKNNNSYFRGIKFWSMPYTDMQEAEKVWNETKYIFTSHTLIIEKTKKGNKNNLPSKSDNSVCHVRPHARNAEDTTLTQQGILLTKQCFWLNNTYIANIIK